MDEKTLKQFCLLAYEDAEASIPLFNLEDKCNGPSISIVIGPNGSGKSRVLSRVVDELCYLDACRGKASTSMRRLRPSSERADIEYLIDGVQCKISRRAREIDCTVNGDRAELSKLPFLRRVATVSHLPTDKFRFLRSDRSDFYRYLGLRQATNLTTTGALEAKVLQSLVVGFARDGFEEKLRKWLSLAGLSNRIGLTITLPNSSFLSSNFSDFEKALLDVASRSGRQYDPESMESRPYEVNSIWLLLSKLRNYHWSSDKKRVSVTVELMPLLADPDDARIWNDGLEAARRWKIFRETSLVFGKAGGRFRFSDLSSGEQNLIGTNARLLAELEPHSLVVIDEPEISLHPEWQIKYVPTLLKSLESTPATHAVIATHSHFMVSDVDTKNAALIMSSNENGPRFRSFDGEVYGRSPENILYRVFGVATAGNSYVEGDLHLALRMLSGVAPMEKDELRVLLRRLEKVRGKDNAAMNVILDQMEDALALAS